VAEGKDVSPTEVEAGGVAIDVVAVGVDMAAVLEQGPRMTAGYMHKGSEGLLSL